jgi:hypothetical protein
MPAATGSRAGVAHATVATDAAMNKWARGIVLLITAWNEQKSRE